MKLLIASDIHGSGFYANKLFEAMEKEQPEKLILLGDLLYHGPRNDLPLEYNPKEVIALLNSAKNQILCVRGNCEAEVDQMVLDFPVMADYATVFCDGLMLYLTHGHVWNENKLPPLSGGSVLLHGHTHVPKCLQIPLSQGESGKSIFVMNPGSVAIPKESSPHSYMIYENRAFYWKDFDGNTFMEQKL